jgi:lysophospholipase L1-like esterase
MVKSTSFTGSGARRLAAVFAGIALVLGTWALVPAASASSSSAPSSSAPAVARPDWVASWAASPMPGTSSAQATAGFSNQTVRNIIYTSVGGNSLRVQLSDTFGSAPLVVGAVTVGVVLDGAQLVPGTSRHLTFGGKTSVTIPAGAQLLSDPLRMRVQPLEELAVSVYLPDATGPATTHQDAQQDNYIAPGNHAGDAAAAAYATTTGSWYFVDGLDVRSSTAGGTIVAFGDSITDGYQSLVGSNARWPNYLARRLDALLGAHAPGVVDEGISGNRVLNDSSCFGVSAQARFARDALSQPGVKAVILLEGINDIGFAGEADTGCYTPNNPTVTAAQIEAGYLDLIKMAHARGVKIYGGTLTPFGGSNAGYGGNYGIAKGEALREQVNNWIRTSGVFDGVIDFSGATADPYDPLYLNPVYNSGDSLHPGDLGYEAMAATVPLRFVR